MLIDPAALANLLSSPSLEHPIAIASSVALCCGVIAFMLAPGHRSALVSRLAGGVLVLTIASMAADFARVAWCSNLLRLIAIVAGVAALTIDYHQSRRAVKRPS